VKYEHPFYLVFVALDSEHKDAVNVNIRISGKSESAAETNAIPLAEFRRIFLNFFKTPAENLDRDIQRLLDGDGFTIYLSASESAIRDSGLLTRHPNREQD
jgi:hypothetical protein